MTLQVCDDFPVVLRHDADTHFTAVDYTVLNVLNDFCRVRNQTIVGPSGFAPKRREQL